MRRTPCRPWPPDPVPWPAGGGNGWRPGPAAGDPAGAPAVAPALGIGAEDPGSEAALLGLDLLGQRAPGATCLARDG